MEHRELKVIDPADPYVPFHSGYYSMEIRLENGKVRRMITYIPADTQSSVAGIFLLPPSGVSAEDFLAQSNWVDLADGEETKERFVLFVLEAEKGGWNTREPYGLSGGDVDYVHTAFGTACLRNIICVHEAKYYMVGYQDGGTMAQMAAMFDPALYGGLVSVDAGPVADGFVRAAGEDLAVNLMGYQDPKHVYGIKKSDIPLPVWLIGPDWPDALPEALYWRKACGCENAWTLFDRETRVFSRTAETPYPMDQDKAAYRVWTSKIDGASVDLGRRMNRRIWKDFLYGVRRWMADPGGSLRMTKDPVRDLGMEYRYEMVDGFRREWYIHVPQAIKTAPEKPVPLVFAMHGYSCSGEIYIGNSGWHDVADKYGFIVVFPSAIFGKIQGACPEGGAQPDNAPLPTWNTFGHKEGQPYEIHFFEYILEDLCRRYAIDRSRIYATGHSNGSMMTSWLALAKPELFAAVAPCSGILHMAGAEACLDEPEVKKRAPVDLPIWMFGGEEEPWLLDSTPKPDNRTGASLYVWWEMNRMPGEKPVDFGAGKVHAGRWHDWIYEKDGMPMVCFSGIDGFPHATMPEMSFRIWEEFFSRFSRLDGKIVYRAP